MPNMTGRIQTNPEACRRCQICQLVCSLRCASSFNPAAARIMIGVTAKQGDRYVTDISFTDDCDECGLCVSYCHYGVLTRRKRSVP